MKSDTKKSAAKSAGAVGIGTALAVVITQILDASGIHLGEDIVGPLGVVIYAIIREVGHLTGSDA